MTATPLTLDEGTDVRLVAPQPMDALPSRRRQREHERSAEAEDRIPALAALDAAAEFVLVVRNGDGFRVFSQGGLVAQDPDGREVRAGTEGQEIDDALPLLVGRHDGSEAAPAAVAGEAPVPALEATQDDADDLFESLLELGDTQEAAAESVDTDELGETNRVPGFVRGSAGSAEPESPDAEDESPEGHLAVALVLEDGRRIVADHTVVLGRSPSLRADEPGAEHVALDPVLTDISRNHLEIRIEGEAVVALDLASTNGTVLTRAGSPRLVPSDEAIRLLPGDSLNLGGSAVVEVEAV
ncbi:FHA domain-containing protein [Naasia sp. SYSU D00948]|uniref:FHA domain-containing protein n=1 Tax=Naasia sp. SYSU D00948 TaxID=2817379 RepID=UPI001B30E1C9|nr:FHA domain-containing protein [Naasia sp. SYSU D00948]